MIYPYSQHDIPPLPAYQQQQTQNQQYQYYTDHNEQIQQHTSQHQQQQPSNRYLPSDKTNADVHSVQIQPSLSFELKHNGHAYEKVPPSQTSSYYQPQQPHQVEPSIPVIVLRIPGPHKYAAHLQRLLQEYLEVRAAEYIKALQEEEYHQQQYQPAQQLQEEEPQPNYQQSYADEPQSQNYHHQEVKHIQETNGNQQHDDSQYESYQPQGRQQEEDAIDSQQTQEVQPHQVSYIQQEHSQYTNQPSQHYGPPAATQEKDIQVQENYPSPLHTQVIFTGHGNYAKQMASVMQAKGYEGYQQQQQQSYDYPMAAVKYVSVQQSNAAPPTHQYSEPQRNYVYQYHQQHQPAEEEETPSKQIVDEDEDASSDYEHQTNNIVSITQRSVDSTDQYTHSPHERPHNYHAHGIHTVNPNNKMKSRY